MNEAQRLPRAESEASSLRRPGRVALAPSAREEAGLHANGAEQAARALQIAYVALPLIAGIDKFSFELTDWAQYLAPAVPLSLGVTSQTFMYGVGVLEILLGIGIALRPRVFGDVYAAWLSAIIVNLLAQGLYFDIALRDFALAAGACALARLSRAEPEPNTT